MFVVQDVLVSDRIVDAPFACNLGACHGACCVQGDSGAPLEEDELRRVEEALPRVKKYLRPEALSVIDESGVWEERKDGGHATTCVDGAECVFVTYEGPVAKCALQRAYHEGRISFPKPISCHLFPVRVERYGDHEALNYEEIALCVSARGNGRRQGMQLAEFLREPLIRKYGEQWYDEFLTACKERRAAFRPPEKHISAGLPC